MENYIFTYSAIILYFACAALLFFHIKQPADSTTGLSKKHIVLIGLGGLMYGFAQMMTHETPWAMAVAPLCVPTTEPS